MQVIKITFNFFAGHILFEMCAGYELKTPQPNPANYLDIDNYPQVIALIKL